MTNVQKSPPGIFFAGFLPPPVLKDKFEKETNKQQEKQTNTLYIFVWLFIILECNIIINNATSSERFMKAAMIFNRIFYV